MPCKRVVLLFCLPLALLVPAYPFVSIRLFQLREPTFLLPVSQEGPWVIRKDPYGSGLFGARRSGGRKHRGVDLVAPVGTPVVAAKSGWAYLGTKRNGLGRYVEIRHPDGWVSRYAHLEKIAIGDRQKVRRGDPIGTVGKTGNAKRRLIQPHLHFEVWSSQGEPVDPLTVLEDNP